MQGREARATARTGTDMTRIRTPSILAEVQEQREPEKEANTEHHENSDPKLTSKGVELIGRLT